MGRVVINAASETSIGAFGGVTGVTVSGEVETRAVIAGNDRPLLVWQHVIAPGGEISLREPGEGHAIYVHDGAVSIDGALLEAGGAVIVEHGGAATVWAEGEPATLLHFHRADGKFEPSAKRGGHVHVVSSIDAKRYGDADFEGARADIVMYADSTCPTCDLWLHRADMSQPFPDSPAHLHTEDEIIVVTDGVMSLGTRKVPKVTALAIDADTTYKFGLASPNMSFVNFRACDPFLVLVNRGRKSPPVSERILLESM